MRAAAQIIAAVALAWALVVGAVAMVLGVGLWINPEWLDYFAVVTSDGTQIDCATSPWTTFHVDDEKGEWVWCNGRPYRLRAPGGESFGAGSDLRSILVDRW